MSNHPINDPHDKFIKNNLSRIDSARSFIETYLLDRIDLSIDLLNLRLFQNDSVDTNLLEYLSDLIFYTETIPQRRQFYLIIEHKSFPDRNIGMQMDNYIHVIRENHAKSDEYKNDLFYVVPVILYHGKRKWDISRAIPPIGRFDGEISRFAQTLNYEFFDISRIPDDRIKGNALLRITFLTLKYIHSPELVTKLNDILVIFRELAKERDIAIDLNAFSLYLENAAPKSIRKRLLQRILEWKNGGTNMEVSRVFQTVKNEGIAEGMARGKIEGKIEGKKEGKIEEKTEVAANMLKRGMSKGLINEITGLSMKKIDQIEREQGK